MNEGKLEPRARKCIFLGYANTVKWYRLWCPNSKFSKFLISRDETFNESVMLSPKKSNFIQKTTLDMRQKMEFATKASKTIEKAISTKPKEEELQLLDDKKKCTTRATILFG